MSNHVIFVLLVILVLVGLSVWRWAQYRQDRAEEVAVYGEPVDDSDLLYTPPAGLGIVFTLVVLISADWNPWLLAEWVGVSIAVIAAVAVATAPEDGLWAYWRPRIGEYALFCLVASLASLLFLVELADLQIVSRPVWDPIDERTFVPWFQKVSGGWLDIFLLGFGVLGWIYDDRTDREYRRELQGTEGVS